MTGTTRSRTSFSVRRAGHQQANNLLFRYSVLFNFLPSLEKVKSGKVKKLVYNYVTRSIDD